MARIKAAIEGKKAALGVGKAAPVKRAAAKKAAVKPSSKPAVKSLEKQAAPKRPSARPASKQAPKLPGAKAAKLLKSDKLPSVDKASKPVKAEKVKVKLVRDSFTMPQEDWALIQVLKDRALGFKRPVKKSELLRAGLQALSAMSDEALQAALSKLVALKPGRPKA